MKLADRMDRLGTETAFEVLAKAKALEAKGREIVHLEIGEPDFDTPAHIREATKKAIDEGRTHYGPAAGIPELREAIAESIGATRNISVNPDQVVVTLGAKPIMFFSILALAQAGDEVIYPNPGFPIYESVINFTGAKAVPIPLREEKEFRFDVNELRPLINNRTKMIILNSPHNPTGGMLSSADLEAVAEMIAGRDIMVLSDEIYEFVLYENKFKSIASLPGMQEKTIILHGFSKTYAMTGWRLGFGVMPEWMAERIAQLQVNSNSCPNSFVQYGGLAALKGPQDDSRKMVAEFKRRRDVIVKGLNSLEGVSCLTPGGAFYVFPNVTELVKQSGKNSKELADYFLNEAGVAALSGTAFGEYGDGFLRLSYANSVENIQKAIQWMDEAIRKL